MSGLVCGCDPDCRTFGKLTPYVSPDCTEGHTAEDCSTPEPECWCTFADERVCPKHGRDAA